MEKGVDASMLMDQFSPMYKVTLTILGKFVLILICHLLTSKIRRS